MPIIRKLHSARHRLEHALAQWRESKLAASKRRTFEAWVDHLSKFPPQVLIGSNFAEYGGVRHHIHAIQRYSSLRTELAPSDSLLETLSPHEITNTYRDVFFGFRPPPGMKAVHSHVFPWFIEWCRGIRGSGPLWVHTYHLPYFPEHADGELEPWQKRFNEVLLNDARHADVRLSVSRWQQEYLRTTHSIETRYVPNGVDVRICDLADGNRFRHRTRGQHFVLYVGRNDPVKNPGDFVRLAQRLSQVRFVMLGRGLSRDVLESQGLSVPENLAVFGETSHHQTMDAIAACSALVVTSKREGLPTLVLEGMALGKAVVVPDEAGCVEAIGNHGLGFIYQPSDIDDLAAKTTAAFGDMSKAAERREHVLKEFDWRVIAPQLDAIYSGESGAR